jgi:hypothetical protein
MMTNTQSVSTLGFFQKDVPFLPELDEYNFENFLRLYLTKDNQFFYNLLSFSVNLDDELDPSTYYTIVVTRKVPWTTISYNEYRNMGLWWLIMAVNNIKTPVQFPEPGTELKILYPEYVRTALDEIIENTK